MKTVRIISDDRRSSCKGQRPTTEVGKGGDVTDFFLRLGWSREDFLKLLQAYHDDYGIELKTWLPAKERESIKNSYYVEVSVWQRLRRVIERDGLLSLQVTAHHDARDCWSCIARVIYVLKITAEKNIPCFWTCEPDDGCLYVTVGPRPHDTAAEKYLTSLLALPIYRCASQEKDCAKQPQAKRGSRKRRHVVQ